MNEKSFWQFAADSIENNYKIVLLTVAESSNSSPGRQGFKMLVREDSTARGTIGGGIMEKNMVDYSFDIISGKENKSIKRLQHSKNTKRESSGLICGGYQTVIFSLLTKENLNDIQSILMNIDKRKRGTLFLANKSFCYDSNVSLSNEYSFNYENDEEYFYKEQVGFIDTVYVIGGGHVGLAVCEAMKFIGFYVVVFDHREEIFTMEQNVYADEKIITEYKKVKEYIREGSKSYAVIVTPQHAGDRDALSSVIKMDLKYLGMMGSKRKIKTVFDSLREEGVNEDLLERVHSPIGLEIEALTPNEIAISIAAEIIQVKRTS